MKIVLAQQNYRIGDFEGNTDKIIRGIREAKTRGADLVVFSELSVCGYPPRDFLEFDDFIRRSYDSVERIKAHTRDVGALVGSPVRNPHPEGKRLFNGAWLLYDEQVKGVVHKTLLPTYDIFDEYRYFEPGFEWKVLEFGGKRLAVTICEDVWNVGENLLYRASPMDELIRQKPDVMINLSASPFDYVHHEEREGVIRENVRKYRIPMFYCNAVGSQTEVVYDGRSIIMDAQGNVVRELPAFEEAIDGVELKCDNTLDAPPARAGVHVGAGADALAGDAVVTGQVSAAFAGSAPITGGLDTLQPHLHIPRIRQALLLGIRDYFRKLGFTKAIVGSSGGIDSAVTLALACEALGPENVRAVLMPSPFSSVHSVSDAVQLSKNLGNPYDTVPIKGIYDAFLDALHPLFGSLPFSLAEENMQSRSRGNILMSIANKFGYILLNTSNKSELSTGYGTLYGDMAGGLGVLGDLYKLQVYALAAHINRDRAVIPENILTKAPSAELREGQKDTDSLPTYEMLDPILYEYIERRLGPAEIIGKGFDPELLLRVLQLVNGSEYKRNQFCPIIRVSPKAFGVGRRLPIVATYLS